MYNEKNDRIDRTDRNDRTDRTERLKELSGSDFEIADGQEDIRGWDVNDAHGNRIGEVDDLIFDTQSLKVRYIKLDMESNKLDLEDRDVLIPIGLAQLHNDDDEVLLNNVTADQLRALPEYDEDKLDSDYESGIRRVFGGAGMATMGAGAAMGADADFYNHEHFNDDNLMRNRRGGAMENNMDRDNNDRNQDDNDRTIPVINEQLNVGKREVEGGGIRLRTRMVENPVEKTVNLREETVNVERNDVDRAATDADFNQDTVEMRERDEVPVVNKEARVVEEIKLNKDVNEREETVRDTVRETEVDVDKLKGKDLRNDRSDSDRL